MELTTDMLPPNPAIEAPYVGLRQYERYESDLLTGRDKYARFLTDKVFSARLTLLYSSSGLGKSSLLRALVIPELEREECRALYFDAWAGEQPEKEVRSLLEDLATSLGLADALLGPDASLVDWVRLVTSDGGTLVLILDQFEEFLLNHAQRLDPLRNELATLVHTPDLNLRVLVALREEFLASLEPFREDIVTLFQSTYRLEPLGSDDVREAIRAPAKRFGMEYDQALLDQIVADLEARSATCVTAQGTADLPMLQIVCLELWNAAKIKQLKMLTLDFYIKTMGGMQAILGRYVRKVMPCRWRNQLLSAHLMKYLAPPSGLKMSYAVSDIASMSGLDPVRIKAELHRLADDTVRIVRMREYKSGERFELQHDALIPIIAPWRDRVLQIYHVMQLSLAALLTIVLIAVLTYYWIGKQKEKDIQAAIANQEEKDKRFAELRDRWQQELRNGQWSRALAYLGDALNFDKTPDHTLQVHAGLINAAIERTVPQSAIYMSEMPKGHLLAAALSNNGERLVVASSTEIMYADVSVIKAKTLTSSSAIHSIKTSSLPIENEDKSPTALALSPDGDTLIVGFSSNRLKHFHWKKGKFSATPLDDRGSVKWSYVRSVQFSPNGKFFATVDLDGTVNAWQASGTIIKPTCHPPKNQRFLAADIDNKGHVLAGGTDSKVYMHGSELGLDKQVSNVVAHDPFVFTSPIKSDAFLWHTDSLSKSASTCPEERQNSSKHKGSPETKKWILRGSRGEVIATFNENGTYLATTNRQGIHVWNTDNGTLVRELGSSDDPPLAVAFSGPETVMSFHESGVINTWDFHPLLQQKLLMESLPNTTTYSAAFEPVGSEAKETRVVTTHGRIDGVRIWDLASSLPQPVRGIPEKITKQPSRFAFPSSDGRMWLIGTPEVGFALDPIPTRQNDPLNLPCLKVGEPAHCLKLNTTSGFNAITPSIRVDATPTVKGHRRFLTLTESGELKLYDDVGHALNFPEGIKGITAAAFSANGNRLAVCAGSLPTIYDTWTLKSQKILEGHTDDVISVAFHPNNADWLLSTGVDGTVKVWNLGANPAEGSAKLLLATLQGHHGDVTSGSFDPSRSRFEDLRVVTSGIDGTVRVWSIEEPNFSITLEVEGDDGKVGEVRSAVFDAAGERILTAGLRGGARVWAVPKLPRVEPDALKKLIYACFPWKPNPNTMVLMRGNRDMPNCMKLARNAGFLAR
jgi:WD40 repeat protein